MKAKKVMALVLAAVLLVCTSVMATIAYLTDSEKVVNTFTVGKVHIELHETGETDEDKDGIFGKEYHLLPGQPYDKDPTVTVLKDSDKCYVRMLVTISNISGVKEAFDVADGTYFMPENFVGGTWNSSVWPCVKITEADDKATYEFWYNGVVDAKNEAKELAPLFTKIVMPDGLDNDDLQSILGMDITVIAHAIQADGFADAAEAWSNF